MLVPAISRKDELEKLFAEHLYDDNMFLYNGYAFCTEPPDLTPCDCCYRWAIVSNINNRVIGYFAYMIDCRNDCVNNFGLYSFEPNFTVGLDVYRKMKELVRTHRRVEWRMIDGNPVQRHYDKFCARHGGRKVVLTYVIKSPTGGYLHEHIYEIINYNLLRYKEK